MSPRKRSVPTRARARSLRACGNTVENSLPSWSGCDLCRGTNARLLPAVLSPNSRAFVGQANTSALNRRPLAAPGAPLHFPLPLDRRCVGRQLAVARLSAASGSFARFLRLPGAPSPSLIWLAMLLKLEFPGDRGDREPCVSALKNACCARLRLFFFTYVPAAIRFATLTPSLYSVAARSGSRGNFEKSRTGMRG